jgi:DNA topoisomerase I
MTDDVSDSTTLPGDEPEAAARRAGLRYVDDEEPGITRRRCGRGFSYRDPRGETIRDPEERERIETLAIPPAWTDVWICPRPDGHLQATGRDDAGRKQYRYHPRWREARDRTKFHRMLPFGRALPGLREELDRQLRRRTLDRDKVLALVVRLLEESCIRVGNEEYRRQNGSYGLTTLRRRHVDVSSNGLRFHFRGKGGAKHDVAVSDRRLARAVGRCQELPGHELFQYLDDEGRRHAVDSADVNEFLKEITGEPFTAKDFRTWMGSVHALDTLWRTGPAESDKEAAANLVAMVDRVAGELRNTRAVCRGFYIHPAIFTGYEEGWLYGVVGDRPPAEAPDHLDVEEAGLLRLLEHVAE